MNPTDAGKKNLESPTGQSAVPPAPTFEDSLAACVAESIDNPNENDSKRRRHNSSAAHVTQFA
ncbi:MAG TPA: hypothetical protein VJ001_16440 [Rhodocyclaceae bacterium]|nr:hypothetical protein [Rhodocyclaceae bacterium]